MANRPIESNSPLLANAEGNSSPTSSQSPPRSPSIESRSLGSSNVAGSQNRPEAYREEAASSLTAGAEPVSSAVRYEESFVRRGGSLTGSFSSLVVPSNSGHPPSRSPSQITANGVYVTCKDLCFYTRRKRHTILNNVSLVAKPGELTVIMGPSGSGKTTTLNAIACRLSSGSMTGDVCLNGVQVKTAIVKNCCSYVMANDYLLPYLTVQETLDMAVEMKQPSFSLEVRKSLVAEVLAALELTRYRDSYVGGEWRKGLSTGQIKRLAIGIELLGDPPVFLLDEPTTGLDSKLALQLMRILKKLAERGKTVVCTVHQPNHDAFALFDNLVLMTKGRVAYCGQAKEALSYFQRMGRTCPMNFNPADFLIEIVTDEDHKRDTRRSESSSSSSSSSYRETVLTEYQHRESMEPQETAAVRRQRLLKEIVGAQYAGPFYSSNEEIDLMADSFLQSPEAINMFNNIDRVAAEGRNQPETNILTNMSIDSLGWAAEFRVLWMRSTLNSVRNPMTAFFILLINIVQAFVLGGIFWQLDNGIDMVTTTNLAEYSWWSDPYIQSVAYGLDFDGYQPLESAISYGVDGFNRSVVFDILTSSDIIQWVHEAIQCTYREAGLDDDNYPAHSWTPPPNITSQLLRRLDDTRTPAPIASVAPEQLLSDLTTLLQLADHYLIKLADQYPTIDGKTPLEYWMKVFVKLNPYVDPLLYCLGLPTFSPVYEPKGDVPATPAGLFPHNDFVPFPNRDPYDYNSYQFPPYKPGAAPPTPPPKRLLEVAQALRRRRTLTAMPAPTRKLGSGLSGLITELVTLLTKDPNSPFYKILNAFDYYSDALHSCTYSACQSAAEGIDTVVTFMSDALNTVMTVLNIAGCVFFLSATLGFASYDVLVQFPKERPMYNRESANGLYRSTAYYLSKNCADYVFQLIPAVTWSFIMYWMCGLAISASQFFVYMGLSICVSFAAYGFGYLIAALSPRLEVGVILAPLILVNMLLLAGFFIRDPLIPAWIGWFKYFSIYRWGFFGMLANEFPIEGTFGNLPNSLVLVICGVTEPRVWVSCLALLTLGFGFRLLGFFALVFVNRSIGIES